MTRLELAKEIYRTNIELGVIRKDTTMTVKSWCKFLLHGTGLFKAQRKPELENWLANNLKKLAERN